MPKFRLIILASFVWCAFVSNAHAQMYRGVFKDDVPAMMHFVKEPDGKFKARVNLFGSSVLLEFIGVAARNPQGKKGYALENKKAKSILRIFDLSGEFGKSEGSILIGTLQEAGSKPRDVVFVQDTK